MASRPEGFCIERVELGVSDQECEAIMQALGAILTDAEARVMVGHNSEVRRWARGRGEDQLIPRALPERGGVMLAGHAPEAYPTGVPGRMSGVQRGGGAVSENEKRPANTGLFSTPRPGLEPGTYRLTAGEDYPQSHQT